MFWMQGPARSQEDNQQHREKSDDEASCEIDPCRMTLAGSGNAGNLRHLRLEAVR